MKVSTECAACLHGQLRHAFVCQILIYTYVLKNPFLWCPLDTFTWTHTNMWQSLFPNGWNSKFRSVYKMYYMGASPVAQWLGVRLPMQGTRVRAPVREDPTCRGAARPVSHNYWACASGACAPQRERPRQWEARAPRWRVATTRRNWRKPSHRNEDPTQP